MLTQVQQSMVKIITETDIYLVYVVKLEFSLLHTFHKITRIKISNAHMLKI